MDEHLATDEKAEGSTPSMRTNIPRWYNGITLGC